jgi:ABC-type multidrug transport system fused ATPase/permease subunit
MLRAYWDALAGRRRSAAVATVLLTLSGLAEALGIAALLPLLSANLTSDPEAQSQWLGLSGDALTLTTVAVVVALGLLAALLRYAGETRTFSVAVSLERSLRARMVASLLEMRWTDYMGVVVGDVIKSVLVETSQIRTGVIAVLQAVGSAVVAAVFVVVAFVVSPGMTAAVAAFGVLTALLYRRVGRRSAVLSRELSERSGGIAESTNDLLMNAKFYRSVGLEDGLVARLDTTFGTWAGREGRVLRYLPAIRLGADVAGLLFIGAVLIVTLVVLGNSLAGALVFLALFYRLAPRLQQAQQYALQARTQVEWWHTWLRQFNEAHAARVEQHGTTRFERLPRIELDAVTVTFPGRAVAALKDVSCNIAPGECLGVVGASGAGKTTVLDVMTALLEPTAGAVHLDGIDLADVDLRAWRERIGLVMQENPTFQASVLENIAWGDPTPDVARVERVAEMAHLTEVISALPQGLHTEIGQRGGRFSGGQRQRLALARALYRDPWLLILDEATSSLDAETERVIQRALVSLRGSCSMIVVAHGLKTVEIADHILVLSSGQVVQRGTWVDLLAQEGLFRRLAVAQGIDLEHSGTRSR